MAVRSMAHMVLLLRALPGQGAVGGKVGIGVWRPIGVSTGWFPRGAKGSGLVSQLRHVYAYAKPTPQIDNLLIIK